MSGEKAKKKAGVKRRLCSWVEGDQAQPRRATQRK
jgi:hypothetical protein